MYSNTFETFRSELQDKSLRLQNESDQILQQLEDAELKASAALKQAGTTEAQFAEAQVNIILKIILS